MNTDLSLAPKDGTPLLLRVRPTEADDDHTSFEDNLEPYVTVGWNSLKNTGEDAWEFAGWDWSQDCFTTGYGTVIGWMEIPI